MSPDQFEYWVRKQQQLAKQVWVCYEAGPFGFVLARKMIALGVECLVVAPRDWDEEENGTCSLSCGCLWRNRNKPEYRRSCGSIFWHPERDSNYRAISGHPMWKFGRKIHDAMEESLPVIMTIPGSLVQE